MSFLFDYEVLRVIWWILLGILLGGYAIMDGFDLGASTLLPFIAKTDMERRIVLNSIEPYWEGNQIWLILGGGAIFAAWPAVYAVSFSGLYLALFLLLIGIGLRPVAFTFRNKLENPKWRSFWDWAHFTSGFLPALLCGVAVGNVMLGLPFIIDSEDMSISYKGSFFALLNPYALLIGLVSLSMLIMQGSTYVALKTEDIISKRSANIAQKATLALLVLYALAAIITAFVIKGYVITSEVVYNGTSNPLGKEVVQEVGAWFNNFSDIPLFALVPLVVVIAAMLNFVLLKKEHFGKAFIASSVTVFFVVTTAGVSMFPFILPSSFDLASSLTVWDSSSSQLTLKIMLIVAVVFVPIVITYTAWVFRVLKGPVNEASVAEADHYK